MFKPNLTKWLNTWKTNPTRFDKPAVNASLITAIKTINNIKNKTILLPLCGASKDLFWLAQQGAAVTGVEISPIAIKKFFTEHNLTYTEDYNKPNPTYESTDPDINITLVEADFLQKQPAWIHTFDLIFDNTAFITIKKRKRTRYTKLLTTYLNPTGTLIMNTHTFNLTKTGLIHSIDQNTLEKYFAKTFQTQLLCKCDVEARAELKKHGITSILEQTFILKPLPHLTPHTIR